MLRFAVSRRSLAQRFQTSQRALLSTSTPSGGADDNNNKPADAEKSTPVVSTFAASEVPIKKKMKPQDRPKKQPWSYAVRKGREIGVFKTWDEAKGKVLGFPGAIFKPFKNEVQAKKWLDRDISKIAASDLPEPKKDVEESSGVKPSRYVLNFGTALSTVEDPSKKGVVGMGWILRKLPERTLVVAGCDLFDSQSWKNDHPARPGYVPKLPRELPLLEALYRGLEDVKRVFKLEEAAAAKTSGPSTKLPFPLSVQSDHLYTIGLLAGANPTVPEMVKPLKVVKSKLQFVSAVYAAEQVSLKDNALALGLARASLSRNNPKMTIEGGGAVTTYARLLAAVNQAPDVPPNVNPATPPANKGLEVNGSPVVVESKKNAGNA